MKVVMVLWIVTIVVGVPYARTQACEADIVFVVDATTSVTDSNFQLELAFLKDLVNRADVNSGNVRFGVLIFSSYAYIQFHMNEYSTRNNYINAISTIPYRHGWANTADALEKMRTEMFTSQNGDRPGAQNIAVVLLDGVSNVNSRRTIPEAEFARDANITVYAIGIGIQDTHELDGIANKPLDKYRINVKDFEALQNIDKSFFKSLCLDTSDQ